MPIKKVPLVTGEMYHVYNRGVDKRNIFLNKADYLRWYSSLKLFNKTEAAVNYSFARAQDLKKVQKLVQIYTYAFLPNHYHLLVEQLVDGGISEFMKRISTGYTSFFNEKYERSGSLFQGKFKRVHIESEEQYMYLNAYVNENFSVHGIKNPGEVIYSSLPHYLGQLKSQLLKDEKPEYSEKENNQIAQAIFKRRADYKNQLFDD